MAASVPHLQYHSSNYYSFVPTDQFKGDASISAEETYNNNSSDLLFNNNINGAINNMVYDINSSVSVASQIGLSDNFIVPQISEIIDNVGFSDVAVCDYQPNQVFEECSGLVPNFWSAHQDWGIQGKKTKVEETMTEVKVGRYSVEERKGRILRYLNKRNHRNFNKTIKYACRKTLADKRVRIRGRFAKNNESIQQESVMNTTHASSYNDQNNSSLLYDDLMKCDEDYWFQAAMANLVQLPYLAG